MESELSDSELVTKTLTDNSWYTHIIQRYHDALYRYAVRMGCRSPEAIEDILQEAFIKIYVNLRGYNPSFKFSSWVYRIAHNEVINYFRKNKTVLTPTNDDKTDWFAGIPDNR